MTPPPGEASPEALAGNEAVRLFVERAGAARPGFALRPGNAAAVAELCRRLDGIPLALELAAARASVLPVGDLLGLLEDRFRLLTGGSRTALPRQQTLAATVDWSYALLAEPERHLFERLSVFAGGWTLAVAERVAADPTGGVLQLLTRLVERSLVVAEEDGEGHARFRLLETLREYGREHLDASGGGEAGAVRDRHLIYYLTLAEEAAARVRQRPRERDDWLRRLDGEHENLRAALAWGAERDPAAGLRLAVALHWFWWYRRRHLEGQRWLETLLAGAPGEGPLQARALFRIGHLLREYGDLERARAALTAALARFAALDDQAGQAGVLGSLTLLHAAEGRPAEARRCAEQRLARSREFGAPAEVAIGLNQLGLLAAQEGDFAAASRWYEESSGARPPRG